MDAIIVKKLNFDKHASVFFIGLVIALGTTGKEPNK